MSRPTEFKHLEPDFLFEYNKGGDGGMGAMIMMMQQQQAQAALDAKNAQIKADNDRTKAERAAKDDAETALESSNERIESTYNSALTNAKQKLIKQGYTGAALDAMMNDFTNKLSTARGALDKTKPIEDPTVYFNDKGLDELMSQTESTYQGGLDKEFNKYADTGFANKRITDEADDAFINAILEEQQGRARSSLEDQRARGAITDAGFATGSNELSRQRNDANKRAQDLGMGVLSGRRGELEKTAEGWKTKGTQSKSFDNFNYSGLGTELDTQTGKFLNSLESDIANAISGTEWFDIDKLVGKAGTATGITNTPIAPVKGNTSSPLMAPIDNRILSVDDEEARRRQGVF